MIRPLSYRLRVFYLVIAVVFFMVSVPLLIFYALGYRFGDDWRTIHETGGVHVWTGNSQTDILIDNVIADRTSFLGRSVFVQNLEPGAYLVAAKKDGYRNWSQTVDVLGSRVTEVNALMVLEQNRLKVLSVGTTTQDIQVGEEVVAYRPEVDITYIWNLLDDQAARATTSPRTMLKATSTPITSSMYSIFRSGTSTLTYMPCVQNEFTGMRTLELDKVMQLSAQAVTAQRPQAASSLCQQTQLYDAEDQPIVWFDFYPRRDDVLLIRTPNDLYAVEITNTAPRHIYKLYSGPGRVITDGRQLYVAIGSFLYEIEL